MVVFIGLIGFVSTAYSGSSELDLKYEILNSVDKSGVCVEYVGGNMVLMGNSECSSGEYQCSCASGQCCSAGGGICECQSCDGDGIDWGLIRDILIPILLP